MNHFQKAEDWIAFQTFICSMCFRNYQRRKHIVCVITEVPITDCLHSTAGLFMFDQMGFVLWACSV